MSKLLKFKKALEKKNKYNLGLSPIRDWISVGNAGLNYAISGDMNRGIAVGRVSAFAGLNGTGKSFLAGNVIREAQDKGYFAVYVDTEYATSDGFMEKIGVDMHEDKFLAVNSAILEEVIEFINDLFQNTDKEDKIILVVDSLSNLQPARDMAKFDKGEAAYGQGLREKLLKQLVTNVNSRCGDRNMAAIFTSHMYVAGADTYGNPILKPNVGEGTLYLPSTVVQLSKKDLKDGKEMAGIEVTAKMLKTRFTMKGASASFCLPWNSGMDFLEGSLDILEDVKIVEKNGGWYSYPDRETGEVVKFQKSTYDEHSEKLLNYLSEDQGEVVEKDEDEAHKEYLEE